MNLRFFFRKENNISPENIELKTLNYHAEVGLLENLKTVLFQAIDDYISWRKNKSKKELNGRHYKSGILTRARHFTEYGELRARLLKNNLKDSTETCHIIYFLQEQFKTRSRLHHHSLDTYLLERIYQNKHLFFISEDFGSLSTIPVRHDIHKVRENLQKVILNKRLMLTPEYTFQVAKFCDEHKEIDDNRKKALIYYSQAMRSNHQEAFSRVEAYAKQGNVEAQYLIALEYYYPKKQFYEAIFWLLLAAEQEYFQAIYYLSHSEKYFNAEHIIFIAKAYDEGKNVAKKNIKLAIVFYEKALALNSLNAALRLVHLYAVESNQKLETLAKSKPENAYAIAKEYEENSDLSSKYFSACFYYIIGIQSDNDQARILIIKRKLDQLSQYLTSDQWMRLGQKYLNGLDGVKKDYREAKRCFENASERGYNLAHLELAKIHHAALGGERNDTEAKKYYKMASKELNKEDLENLVKEQKLTSKDIISMATLYQNGKEVDWSQVIMLYQVAADLKDTSALLYLAQFYQTDHSGFPRNPELAFSYYLAAARLHCRDAISPLERLAEHMNPDNQRALSEIYATVFNDHEKSKHWTTQADEVIGFNLKM